MKALLIRLAALFVAAHQAQAECQDVDADLAALHPAAWAAAAAQEATAANAKGLLWEIRAGDAPPSYLFGTFHFGGPEDSAMTRRAVALAREARLVYSEVSPEDELAFQQALQSDPTIMLNAAPAPLADWLPAELADRAAAQLAESGVRPEAAAMIQPWMLGLMLAVPPCVIAAQQARGGGMDKLMVLEARAAGAETRALETWRSQLDFFTGKSLEAQREEFRLSIASQFDREATRATHERLYAEERPYMIWLSAIEIARAQAPEMEVDALADDYWDRLIRQRNLRMAETLAPELARGGVVALVGALHLSAADGLVALIRAQGHEVTRLE